MTVNELLGLSADANQAAISDRVMTLVQNERDLLEVTGKDTVAAALGVVIAQKDAATELEKARAALAEHDQHAEATAAAELKRNIESVVQAAILDGRISAKDTERQAQLVKHAEKFGLDSLKETVAMLTPRPVRVYQAAMPGNAEEQQLRNYNAMMAANPEMDPLTAALAASKGGR